MPWGGEQLSQISVGEPPPAGYTISVAELGGRLRGVPIARPARHQTGGAFGVGIIFCNSLPSSLTR